ncbi:Fibulin-7 [Larimichthys crocea]|uniref:Fibulin-7 n=1 Tax=Larimichthys crocea TaxID=215358 RepID=A0A6G0IZC4_LARCR|nr:Fibulin-7 [Larimichthys crocea]
MEKVITLLQPFDQLTRAISSAEATAADVIPGVVSLTRLLAKTDESDKGVQTAKHTLLEAVCKRFDGVQTEPLYAIATMVDARYKDRYFDPDKKEGARNMLLKVVDEMASVGSDQQEEAAGASAGDPGWEDQDHPPKKARAGSLLDMYQEIITENDVTNPTTGDLALQVHAYLGEATIPKTACPFKYWSSTQIRFPALAQVARKYLTAPCTSIDSAPPASCSGCRRLEYWVTRYAFGLAGGRGRGHFSVQRSGRQTGTLLLVTPIKGPAALEAEVEMSELEHNSLLGRYLTKVTLFVSPYEF